MATSPLSPRTLLRLGELLRALDRAPLHQVLHDVRAPRLRGASNRAKTKSGRNSGMYRDAIWISPQNEWFGKKMRACRHRLSVSPSAGPVEKISMNTNQRFVDL